MTEQLASRCPTCGHTRRMDGIKDRIVCWSCGTPQEPAPERKEPPREVPAK